MVLLNNARNLGKINAYRAGVDQLPAQSLNDANTRIYCTNLLAIAPSRMLLDAHLTKVQPPVDPVVANSLFTFLAQRFVFTYGANGLNCAKLLNQPDPVTVRTTTINSQACTFMMDRNAHQVKITCPAGQ
jgi:hypothetical protein